MSIRGGAQFIIPLEKILNIRTNICEKLIRFSFLVSERRPISNEFCICLNNWKKEREVDKLHRNAGYSAWTLLS